MADNLNTPVPSGASIATDEIGGVHYPRTKLSVGADGTAVDVSTANPLPTSLAAGSAVAINGNVNPAPCVIAYAIVPSDTVALDPQPSGIYVGTGGNVTLRPSGASADVTYKNLPDASYIAVKVSHVRATGTTATDLIGEV